MRKRRAVSLNSIVKSILWRTNLWNNFFNFFWDCLSIENCAIRIFENTVYDFKFFSTENLNDTKARKDFSKQNKRWEVQGDSVFKFTIPSIVEPTEGLVLVEGKIVNESKLLGHLYPNIFVRLTKGLYRKKQLEKGYYLEGKLGLNYFHFYREVLLSLVLFLYEIKDRSIPIIVHYSLFNSKHFQHFIKGPFFEDLTFVIQENRQLIYVNTLYMCKASCSINNWHMLRKSIGVINSSSIMKKTFLNRPKEVGRSIKNIEEITAVLTQNGFEIVDTEYLTLEEQIKIFSDTKVLVGIHGAGLTNLIFSNTDHIKVIEILPDEEQLRPHYYWLSECLNIPYQAVVGSKEDSLQQFYVNPKELEKGLKYFN